MHVPCHESALCRRAKCHKGKRFHNYMGARHRRLCVLESSILYFVSCYTHESYCRTAKSDRRFGWYLGISEDSPRPSRRLPITLETHRAREMSIEHINPPGSVPQGTAESWVQADGLQVRLRRAGSGPALVSVHG